MISRTLAALAIALALPAAAQTAATPQDKAPAVESKTAGKVTPKDSACLAKAQSRQGNKLAKKKPQPKKVVS